MRKNISSKNVSKNETTKISKTEKTYDSLHHVINSQGGKINTIILTKKPTSLAEIAKAVKLTIGRVRRHVYHLVQIHKMKNLKPLIA